MDKILYSPKEGTTGFWGLRDCPTRPDVTLTCNENCGGECGDICPVTAGAKEQLRQFGLALESCKSNKVEIVNPKVLPGYIHHGSYCEGIKPGDIFDIPQGYQFKEEQRVKSKIYAQRTHIPLSYKTVLRLVKTETKESVFDKVLKEVPLQTKIKGMTPEEADRLWEIKFDKASHDSEYGFIMSPYDAFEILKGFKSALREEIEKMQNECTDDGEYKVLEQLKEKLNTVTPKK